MNYAYQLNDIYSCSWGPPDDGKSMEAPEGVILKAFVNGVQQGRAGKGSIYVFAAGNGAAVDDQCNFDGYTNSIFTMTIGAVDRKGLHPYYSEQCAAMLVVAPSSGSGDNIVSPLQVQDLVANLFSTPRMSGRTNVHIHTAGRLRLLPSRRASLPWPFKSVRI